MGKHARKIQAALERRQKGTPPSNAKFFYRKPGSQNQKKGYGGGK